MIVVSGTIPMKADKIEEADMRFGKAQFLYEAGGNYDFMDQETYETVSFEKDVLGFSEPMTSLMSIVNACTKSLILFLPSTLALAYANLGLSI